ncbi:hypothetical protein BBP40_010619, partial [Aspergillus hancockii]
MALAYPTLIFCSVVFAVLARRMYIAFCGPLKDIPGPIWAKFTRLWEVHALIPGDFERKLVVLHRRYGPIVRIGPNKCSIDDPAAVKSIYGIGRPFVKTEYYSAFTDVNKTSLFAEREPKVHAGMRRRIAKLYSLTNLLSYEGFIDRCTTILEDKLRTICTEQRPIEMGTILQYYAFDVIGSLT